MSRTPSVIPASIVPRAWGDKAAAESEGQRLRPQGYVTVSATALVPGSFDPMPEQVRGVRAGEHILLLTDKLVGELFGLTVNGEH